MHASDLIEILCAAHLGSRVESPFTDRGGLMLVGPPAVLKSTFVSVLDTHYQDAVMVSDINAKSLARLRDTLSTGKITTLVLPELAKLYERADVTALNVEGTLRALTAEGFAGAGFEDARVNRFIARAFVMGAMTPALIEKRFEDWENTGFNRRFLWCLVKLADGTALEKAAIHWQRIPFQVKHVPFVPSGESVPNLTTLRERERLGALVKYQAGGDHSLHIQILTRILAVLKWWYRENDDPREAMDTILRFAPALHKGVEMHLPKTEPTEAVPEKRVPVRQAARALANTRWHPKRRGQ